MRRVGGFFRLHRSLSVRQAYAAMAVALAMGILTSLVLITWDYFRTLKAIDSTAVNLLRSAQSPAMQSAYTLDKILAQQVIEGLFEIAAVTQARIVTEKGVVLAQLDRREEQPERWLDGLLGRERMFSQQLVYNDLFIKQKQAVGTLEMVINGSVAGVDFAQRTLAEVVLGLVRNVLLAWVILLVSRRLVTRPLAKIVDDLSSIRREGETPYRLDIPRGHRGDEIGVVVETLNSLFQEVEQQATVRERILEAIPDAIVYKDGASRWLIANAAARRFFHLESVAWQGMDEQQLSVAVPGIKNMLMKTGQEDHEAWANGALTVFQRYHLTDQGQPRVYEVRKIPAFDAQGRPESLVAIDRDVTESRRAEIDLRIAATAFESREGMVVTDAQGIVLRVNRAFSAITGYAQEEVVGRNLRLLQSGRHDRAFYEEMWRGIKKNGAWQGEIWNCRKNGEIYPEWLSITAVRNVEQVTTHYVGTFSDITLRKAAEEEIARLAFYDHLTELPNRRLMLDRLGHALIGLERHGRLGALLLIDIDNFKMLNDTLGHEVGDLFLREVAARLKSSVRGSDTIARLGGDEFVVILEDLGNNEHAILRAKAAAEKILVELGEPYLLGIALEGGEKAMRSHQCTSSIGIALFGEYPISVDELMKRADTAMYQAKAAGRNTLRFFDPQMQEAVRLRVGMELELRNALAKKQFLLYYQPQVDRAGHVVGAEALVRWQHPERGLVSPKEFIPLAEDTGLILPLGQWVLEHACARLAAWAGQPGLEDLVLAVNVSVRQFSQPDFVDRVVAALRRTGAQAARLKLELTESLLLSSTEEIIAKMNSLKVLGVQFSLDDFGTGYSSLSYLKRLPLDQLKIDQSFVQDVLVDPSDAAIARTVVALGHSLGLSVIAEGVETATQRDFLAAAGCFFYQGFYFSRPVPEGEFQHFTLITHDRPPRL